MVAREPEEGSAAAPLVLRQCLLGGGGAARRLPHPRGAADDVQRRPRRPRLQLGPRAPHRPRVVNLEPGVAYRFAVVLVDHTAGAADGWATGDVVWESGMGGADARPPGRRAARRPRRALAGVARAAAGEYDRARPASRPTARRRRCGSSLAVSADGRLLSRAELARPLRRVRPGRPPRPRPSPRVPPPSRAPRPPLPSPSSDGAYRRRRRPSSASAAPSRPRSGSCAPATPRAALRPVDRRRARGGVLVH